MFCADYILAQEGGLTASLGFSQQIESINEKGFSGRRDEGTRSNTALDFRLGSVTRNQALIFEADTDLVYNFSNTEDGLEIENPALRLDYRLSNRTSEFSLGTSYRRSEINDRIFDETLDEDIIVGTGLREITSYETGLRLGIGTPLEFSSSYRRTQSDFSELVGTDVNDSLTETFSAQLDAQISPVLLTTLSYSRRDRDEDGTGTDSTRDSFGLSANYTVSATTRLRAGLNYTDNESVSATGRSASSGLGFSLGATHDRPNGSLSADYRANETINGTRQNISFGRSYTFRRGDASFSVGASKLDGLDAEPVLNASLGLDLDRSSRLGLSLNQAAATSNDDTESIRTRFSVDYSRELSRVSDISAGIQVSSRNEQGLGAVDEDSLRFDVEYRYALDRDWDLVSGYSFTTVQQDGAEDRETSRIFIGVQRNFDFRP